MNTAIGIGQGAGDEYISALFRHILFSYRKLGWLQVRYYRILWLSHLIYNDFFEGATVAVIGRHCHCEGVKYAPLDISGAVCSRIKEGFCVVWPTLDLPD